MRARPKSDDSWLELHNHGHCSLQVPSASAPRRSFLDDQLDGDSALRSLLDASLESFNTRTRSEGWHTDAFVRWQHGRLANITLKGKTVAILYDRRERKIYFEKLDVAAIQCNLTLIPRPGQRAEVDPVCLVCCTHWYTARGRHKAPYLCSCHAIISVDVQATMGAVSRFRLANVFGIHFSDVHALPLRIGSLQLSHAFMTLNQLTSQIGRHLLWTVGSCCLPCSAVFVAGDIAPCNWV